MDGGCPAIRLTHHCAGLQKSARSTDYRPFFSAISSGTHPSFVTWSGFREGWGVVGHAAAPFDSFSSISVRASLGLLGGRVASSKALRCQTSFHSSFASCQAAGGSRSRCCRGAAAFWHDC